MSKKKTTKTKIESPTKKVEENDVEIVETSKPEVKKEKKIEPVIELVVEAPAVATERSDAERRRRYNAL